MNIKNQIRLSVLISLILVVVISVSIIVSYQHMQVLQRQESLAADVVRGGYELTYLSNDYLINAEPRARVQWEERYTSLQPIIRQLKPENEAEAQSLAIIRDYNEKNGVLFREIPEPKTLSAGSVLFPTSYQQVTWSRINVQSQGMIYEAWRLRQLYNHDVSEARFWNNILVLFLMVLMLVIIGVNYLLISRRLVRSIREVNAGSEVFATGNLDYRIPVKGDDEIGGIAQRLNTMAEQIRAVTASRDELDREITGRKVAEVERLASETRFSELFDTVSSGVAIYDVRNDGVSGKDYIVKDFNKAALALEGKKKEDIVGKSLFDLRPTIDDYGLIPIFKEVWKSGKPAYYPAKIYVDEKYANYYENRVFRLPGGEIVALYNDVTEKKQAEERLLESQTLFRTMTDWTYDWEYWIDPAREVIYVSPSVERITGYSPAEFTTDRMLIDRIIHPDDHILWQEHHLHHVKADHHVNPPQIEFRIFRKDGSLRWIGHVCRSIYTEDGTWAGTRVSNRDITDQKQVDTDLAIAQQQYRDLFENVSIGILRSTPGPEGTITEVNPAALRIFEADNREQLLAVHPSDLYIDHDERCRISEEIVTKGAITGMEVRYKTLKGRVFWGSITSSKKVSDNGRIYFDSTIEDITGRKRAEEQLLLKNNVFESSIAANSIADIRGIIIYVNPAFLKLWGYRTADDAIGNSVSSFFAREEDGLPVIETLNTLGRWEGEFLAKRTDGSTFVTQGIATLIRDKNGDPIGYQSTNLDITDRKRSEEELRASEEKFSTAFKTSPYAITITRIKDGKFIDVNDAFMPITGFSHEEALSNSSVGLGLWVDTEDRKRVVSTLLDGRSVNGKEFLFRKKNGGIITGLFSAQVISLRNEPCILSSILDITDRKRAEEALLESEEKYREFFTTSRDCVFITSAEGTWIDFNDAAMEMFGYDNRKEFAQMPVKDLYFIDGERAAFTALILQEGFVKEYPVRLKRKDGAIINTLITAAPLRNPDDSIKAYIGTIRDVTQQKRAEEQVKTSETRYRRLFESAKDGILILNRDTGKIIDANPFIESLLGYAPLDLLGKHLWDIGLFKDMLLSKIAFEDLQAKEYLRYEDLPLETKSGKRIDVEFVSNVYPVDPTTTVIQCSIRDISDRKTAEDALRQSEEKYRILFTRMVEGSALHEIVYDHSGNPVDYRIIDVNPAFESIVGIRREGVIGKTSREAYGVDAPPYLDIYARVTETGQPEWFEVYFAPMKKHFAISAYSTRKGRFATIFEDITGRKEAEELREHLIRELEQKNAELERFTYTVSHDLKSPLITIKGFAGLIEDDALKGDPVQLKKDISRITAAADVMQTLLSDLIDLSRVGKIINPLEKIPFGTIVNEAVDLLAGPLAKRNVTVDVASSLPVVNVDHTRIREIMVNLIENALKYLGDQTDPVIRIGADMNGETPVFFVQDNGIGIDSRYLERIFNLFERLDASEQGTGIGLTIVRRIIEVHGGKIWAESEGLGKGTTFRFTLPGPAEGGLRGT